MGASDVERVEDDVARFVKDAEGAAIGIRDQPFEAPGAGDPVDIVEFLALLAGAMRSPLERPDRRAGEADAGDAGQQDDHAAVQPRVDPTLAAEVRAYWRKRGWANGMTEAIRADVRTASAILSGPGYLSGLDPDQLATMRRIAVDAHAGDQQAALDEALHARRKVEAASGRMIELVAPRIRGWTEPESASLTKLEAMGGG